MSMARWCWFLTAEILSGCKKVCLLQLTQYRMFCSSVQFVLLNLLASNSWIWAETSPQMTHSKFESCLNYIYVFSPPHFLGNFYTNPPISGINASFQNLMVLIQWKLSRCSCGAVWQGTVYLMVLIKSNSWKVIFSYSATLFVFKMFFTGMGWDL